MPSMFILGKQNITSLLNTYEEKDIFLIEPVQPSPQTFLVHLTTQGSLLLIPEPYPSISEAPAPGTCQV
jgi:hypothetical protein